ncbi:Platelet-activating factor acetylhydrolase [Lasiodiplodia theobromae]|uniref:Platelet-activating factor acetylhydrolase n=1 Tax=Lasiodiplodia theobromae TaxID=45133 RepID=UPI0015C31470|nr:Platelet-activating factor acetylhydrolase [Lasiodiplodia theobromae]KAF4542426.1 Platelet-activating factor acetylhydrolase [Lasiodiplodia theobromae]
MKQIRRSSTLSVPDRISGRPHHGEGHKHRDSGTAALPSSGKVPNAKKPKARPPNTLREKIGFLHSSLPKYTGPYSVGTMDMELPAKRPSNFSHIKRNHRHLLRLETVLFTLYYPTTPPSTRGKPPDGRKKWSRPTWLPRPRRQVARGYGRFAGMGEGPAVPWFAATTMFTKLPAWRNAPLATHWPPFAGRDGPSRQQGQEEGPLPPPFVVEDARAASMVGHGAEDGGDGDDGEGCWEEEWDEEAWERRKMPRFPLMVFSHGLGGNRTAYSSVCGEFASYGFVVCALEHRDGSGPRTYVNHRHKKPCIKATAPATANALFEKRRRRSCGVEQKKNDGDSTSPEDLDSGDEEEDPMAFHQEDCKCEIDHTRKQCVEGYDRIDYIFPKGNPIDTSPHAEKGVDRELRAAQIAFRLAEIEEAYAVLREINHGAGDRVAAANLRTKGYRGASSRGLEGVDWASWRERFHLRDVTVVGHSFGAATTVEMLREKQRERFHWVGQGIMYDIWGAAVLPAPGDDGVGRCGGGSGSGSDDDVEGETEEKQRSAPNNRVSANTTSPSTSAPASSSSSSTSITSQSSSPTLDDPANPSSPDPTGNAISRPLLGINSEAFMYWPSNFRTAASLTTSALSDPNPCPAWLLTVRGTVHLSQSDFSLLYPGTCALLLKQTANPRRAMDLNVDASLEFLLRVLPAAHTNGLVRRMLGAHGTTEGGGVRVLDAPVEDEVPDVRRPEEKWIGGRLKVPHEFRSRVLPKLVRKVKRQKGRMREGEGGGGGGAEGDDGAWSEVWMHVKCPEDVLEAWKREREASGRTV